ncbi:hypothetical protein P7K49_004351, partial [Saguinus oedipus]
MGPQAGAGGFTDEAKERAHKSTATSGVAVIRGLPKQLPQAELPVLLLDELKFEISGGERRRVAASCPPHRLSHLGPAMLPCPPSFLLMAESFELLGGFHLVLAEELSSFRKTQAGLQSSETGHQPCSFGPPCACFGQ